MPGGLPGPPCKAFIIWDGPWPPFKSDVQIFVFLSKALIRSRQGCLDTIINLSPMSPNIYYLYQLPKVFSFIFPSPPLRGEDQGEK